MSLIITSGSCLLALLLQSSSPDARMFDLELELPAGGNTSLYYATINGSTAGLPLRVGDFNGDGKLDVAGAPFQASTLGRSRNGTVQVWLGTGTLGDAVDAATYEGPMLTIQGARSNSYLGIEMRAADMDMDGLDDLMIGSHRTLLPTSRAGEVVMLFGSSTWGQGFVGLDLASPPPVEVQRIRYFRGEREGDRLGAWVWAADLDGNGWPELLTGGDQSSGIVENRTISGSLVIFWDAGHPEGPDLTIAGQANTTILYGIDAGDMLGLTIKSGDLDGNGMVDVAVAAGAARSGLVASALGYQSSGGGDGPFNDVQNMGEVYILWDAAELRKISRLDLNNRPEFLPPMTTLYGRDREGYFGEELFIADVTGDGIEDLLVGALLGEGMQNVTNAGQTFLFRGGEQLRTIPAISVVNPPPGLVTAIYGRETNAISGDSIISADVNNDGIGDIIIGTPQAAASSLRPRAGIVTVLLGGDHFPALPVEIYAGRTVTVGDPVTPAPFPWGVILGNESFDLCAYSIDMADVDGDSWVDYLPNHMGGDGFQNKYSTAGEIHIANGRNVNMQFTKPGIPVPLEGEVTKTIQWSASMPWFGLPMGYEVRYRSPMVTEAFLTVSGTEVHAGDFPSLPVEVLGVRAVFEVNGTNFRSRERPANEPILLERYGEGFMLR